MGVRVRVGALPQEQPPQRLLMEAMERGLVQSGEEEAAHND